MLFRSSSVFAAGPFLTVGDDLKISLMLDLAARYDDNVFLANSGEKGDFAFTITPGVIARYGSDMSKTNVVFSLAESFYRYTDVGDALDADLMALNAALNHRKDGVYKIGVNASFNQYSISSPVYVATEVAGVQVKRDVTRAGVKGEYSVSAKTKLGLGFTYQKVHYIDDMGTDSTVYVVPLNAFYSITPKVDVSAGIQYRRTESGDVRRDRKSVV